jgi:hypothetical protein
MAAGPVNRICRAALQTNKLFEISSREVSMMLTWATTAGFASHRRHNPLGRSNTLTWRRLAFHRFLPFAHYSNAIWGSNGQDPDGEG